MPPMRPEQILVIDDDPYVRRLVTVILEKYGYTVRIAGDGARGLAIVATTHLDLVLLDVHMPTLDGPGFIAALRERDLQVPIVVMSGFSGARHWSRSIAAAGILTKPFNMTELLTVVQQALTSSVSVEPS